APLVVNAVLYATLAAVVGVVVVAVGGGGIEPMRERWRNALRTYDEGRDAVMDERRTMSGAGRPRDDLRRPATPPVDVREDLDPYDPRRSGR
ncbi:MAG: hypothetical protein ACKOUQ_12600, partial [Aquirufa sp.]